MATTYIVELHRGTLANRPATGNPGEPYFCLDTGQLFVWNGSAWVQVGDGSKTITVIVSSADLRGLPGTPKNLIPAGGANTIIVVHSTHIQYKFGSIAYTLGNADNFFTLIYTGGDAATQNLGIFMTTAGLMDQGVNSIEWQAWAQTDAETMPQTSAANKGVDLTIAGTTPGLTLGNGTLVITISYNVINLS